MDSLKPTKGFIMSIEFNGKTSVKHPIPETMKAWVLGNPGQLMLIDKPIVMPGKAEVLVKIDAVAICATDLDVISNGPPALIEGGLPFNKNFTPGHEYMGTVVALGPSVDEFDIGDRVTVKFTLVVVNAKDVGWECILHAITMV